jgi:hypothetical protein
MGRVHALNKGNNLLENFFSFLFMQVILQDGKNLIILSVRDVASRYLLAFIAAIYDISVFFFK